MATELKDSQNHKKGILRIYGHTTIYTTIYGYYMEIKKISRHWFMDAHYVGVLQYQKVRNWKQFDGYRAKHVIFMAYVVP